MKRLKNNEYALNLAYKRLNQAIKNKVEQDIYSAIGELLLWVLTTDTWHKKYNKNYKERRNNDKNGKVILGLRHSYNIMKHIMAPYKIHEQKGGRSFPISFPISIPPIEIKWIQFNTDMKGRHENQECNYKKYLQDKNILDTFEKSINFLHEENNLVMNRFSSDCK